MPKFLSLLNLGEFVSSVEGSPIVNEYVDSVDENGVANVQFIGQKNLQDEINAAFDDTSIYRMIDKYLNGDVNALNVRNGEYVDLTQVPKDLIEAHKMKTFAIKSFNNLPIEVRDLFDNDPAKFALSDNPIEIINKAFAPKVDKVEVTDNGTV